MSREPIKDHILVSSLEELGERVIDELLRVRGSHADIQYNDLMTVGDLRRMTDEELLFRPGIGPATVEKIRELIRQ